MPAPSPRVGLLGLSDEIGPILAEVLEDEGYGVDVVEEPGSLDAKHWVADTLRGDEHADALESRQQFFHQRYLFSV